jgi:hypothetical protein
MRFPFVPMSAGPVGSILMPMFTVRLSHGRIAIDEVGLVDTGSAVNVLPFDLGLRLGLDWNLAGPPLPLSGNVARHLAKAVTLYGTVGNYPPVSLTFAWSQSPIARLLLGHVNFLAEFDACFFRSRGFFELTPRP